jgi:hypothetical protein
MELPTSFKDFLTNIRLTDNQLADLKTGHKTLRERLAANKSLSPLIVTTFLQGSYKRSTATRPANDKRSDVDVVVVTKLAESDYPPQNAMDLFVPFLDDHYKGKWKFQGRSIAIELSYVDLDLVLTSAPSEVEKGVLVANAARWYETIEDFPEEWELAKMIATRADYRVVKNAAKPQWKVDPLRIPDRDAAKWEDTHPLAQIEWTWAKNKACNTHYVNVVKALKWWRRLKVTDLEYPKGYPIEHLVGFCCPDGITSVAAGVTLTLEAIVSQFATTALSKQQPNLQDHGVNHNVFHRVSGTDFATFYGHIVAAAELARKALDATTVKESTAHWRELFGDRFPDAPDDDTKKAGYTPRQEVSVVGTGRFARNA